MGYILKWYNACCLLVVILIITSCSLIAPFSTSSTTTKHLSFAKTAVEVISEHYTDKTATDHVVSVVLQKDCKISRVVKQEEICNEIKPKAYDGESSSKLSNILKENKTNMVLNLKETDLVNLNQKLADGKRKVDDIKKNNIEVLKGNNNEILAHSVLNNRNFDENNSDQTILASNLSSIHNPLEKNFNKMKKFNNKNKKTEVLGYLKSSTAKPLTKNINKMKEFNDKNKNSGVLGYLKKRI